ncbi:peroxide stress protein YaaA [Streptomyces scabiei]|uniref:peroxide stress protein YaaA n=1 Tax=Streptomyces scabiei TaxID=1930 RepID=UPI000766167D|nr:MULTISPECIES: peroxide stress protein YaaA [Streptomyces]MBP5864062.1 peroxide stress protein YaaA [Streptomyces sp. LBUM 1484]MBP5866982.1 peroxide stress protein YaaA [Streptomyces sp. LBUM 1485]MBP5875315.1 peroxide stress protein YaaA [Streptomyces sp. LBUM 1477]MBP5883073.1 peroxide stress protein YaaA [Streptomyces sp. LBUM 1487]MBP5899156.1 peroxide stress protein YaaA [Streptomyces sp. LBUM 1488]
MLVLLPPSEGKAPSAGGAPLKLEGLSLPALTGAREAVIGELVELCAGDEDKAREVLGLSEGLRGEVAKNAELLTAGTRPAGQVYTGVLYDALDLATLETAAKQRAARSLLVFSGLWGAVRVTDRIPSYRCPMGVKLPGLGALGTHWRTPMASALPEAAGGGLVLDLRSSAYTAAWRPKGEVAGRTATVRVLHAPTRKVVSHFNKATKGRIVRSLLSAGIAPKGPAELVEALRDLGYVVEVEPPVGAGKAWTLDVLVDEVH